MFSRKKETKQATIKTNNRSPLQAADAVSPFCSPVKHDVYSYPLFSIKSILLSGKASLCGSLSDRGSMTVEASIVLPFFLLLLLSLFSFLEVIRLQNGITMGLREAGMPMSVYGYAYDRMQQDDSLELTGVIPNLTLSYGYAGEKVREFCKKIPGDIQYYKSSIMENNDVIDLVAMYSIEMDCNVLSLPSVKLASRFYGRAWTGYPVEGERYSETQEQNVYVTPEGTVYHRNRYCTHLQLTILSCPTELVETKRNEDGGKYRLCEICGGRRKREKVYITSQGDCYHTSLDCSGLKRTIEVIPISKVGTRSCCTRCGGG